MPAVSRGVGGRGSLASPFPVPQGPCTAAHHVLSVVAALAIPGSGPPPVASLCSSRRELPGARRGRDCGPRARHRSGWRGGRREGSPPGGRQGWAAQRTPQGRTGVHGRKINVSPNICKIDFANRKKFLMQKNKRRHCLPPSPPSLPPFRCLPPRGPRESRRQEKALQQDGEEAQTHTTREGAALPPAAAPATTPGPQPKPGPEPPPAGPLRLTNGGAGPGVGWSRPPQTARAHVARVGAGGEARPVRALHFRFPATPRPGCQPQVERGLCLGHSQGNLACGRGGRVKDASPQLALLRTCQVRGTLGWQRRT